MAGTAAYGTHLWDGTNILTHVTNISGGGVSLDLEDTTAHDSTGAWEESVATILRSGLITIEINYEPGDARHKELITRMIARTPVTTYEIHMPNGEVWAYTGGIYVTGFTQGAPVAGKLTATVTLKPTGTIVPPA